MNIKKVAEKLMIFDEIDFLVERVLALAKAHATVSRENISLVGDDDWIHLYRMLTDLHDVANDDVDPELIAPFILRIRLKITVLESLVNTYVEAKNTKQLH